MSKDRVFITKNHNQEEIIGVIEFVNGRLIAKFNITVTEDQLRFFGNVALKMNKKEPITEIEILGWGLGSPV